MARSRTFADGDLLTSAVVNEHLVNHVPNPGDVYDTGWSNLATPAAWTQTAAVQYRRLGLVVHLRGIVQATINNPAVIVAADTIPPTLRPVGQNPVFPVANTSPNALRVTVGTDGSIQLAGSIATGQYLYLNTIQYLAA